MWCVDPTVRVLLPFILAVALGASGCAGSGDDAPDPAQRATTAPPAERHTSEALGYRIEVPPGWLINEGYQEWAKASETLCGSPGVDTFRSPEGDPCLLTARQRVRQGTALSAWVDMLERSGTISYPECGPPTEESSTLDSESAEIRVRRCQIGEQRAIVVQYLALHDRSGYLVMCFSDRSPRMVPFRNDCSRWLDSFTFVT
jgi:hypothetical protein